jgi:UTP:GlnB (protein PII) uridylyltransferase
LKESAAAQLATARAAYVKEAGRGRAGTETARRYADQMDGVVQAVVEAARGCTDLPVAVCAVGGYGRRALCLHSDVDLLIVFDGTIDEREEAFVKGVLQPLWDLRLELGQHVREFADFAEPDLSNPEFLLSLLDLR